jgi:multidrug resistance efflux pump
MQIQKIELNADLSSVENQIASVKSYTEADLSYNLTTPIDGIIWRRHVVNGEDLSEGENVVDVADAHSMFVEAYLQRDFVNSIAIGDRATVYLLDQSSFIHGRVADIQVQERTAKDANVINTIEMDATVLRVNIEIDPGVLKTENIGQLAKVLISSGKPGALERGLIWMSLIFQSHQ